MRRSSKEWSVIMICRRQEMSNFVILIKCVSGFTCFSIIKKYTLVLFKSNRSMLSLKCQYILIHDVLPIRGFKFYLLSLVVWQPNPADIPTPVNAIEEQGGIILISKGHIHWFGACPNNKNSCWNSYFLYFKIFVFLTKLRRKNLKWNLLTLVWSAQ